MENGCFSGQIWPDLGHTTWADMARLGSIGLMKHGKIILIFATTQCFFWGQDHS